MADPVWALVMFDLPVLTKEQRHWSAKYREFLLQNGFSRVQFSVYSKYLVNATGLRGLIPQLKRMVPPDGEVRIIRLTDEQWAATMRFRGPDLEPVVEAVPEQLALITDHQEICAQTAY
jgi:CRISPR-associated protein Cas2